MAVFGLGTALILTIASITLTTIGHRIVTPPESKPGSVLSGPADDSGDDAPAATMTAPGKPSLRPPRKKRGEVKPPEEEDQ